MLFICSAAPEGAVRTEESKEETDMSDETPGKAPETGASAPSESGPGPGPGSGSGSGSSSGPRPGGGRRWRPWRPSIRRARRTRQVLPPQEGMQVLHREDRRHSLSRCAAVAGLCGRARQDRAAASDRRLHHAPAPPDPRHQAGPEHRPAAVCHKALEATVLGCSPCLKFETWGAAHPARLRC